MSDMTFDRKALGFEAGVLLEVLLKHIDAIGRVQIPAATLAKETGLTPGALTRARTELTRHCLLRIEPGTSSTGLRVANTYVLNLCVLEPPSTLVLEEESGQNATDGQSSSPGPADSSVRRDSGDAQPVRKLLWDRWFRRSRTP